MRMKGQGGWKHKRAARGKIHDKVEDVVFEKDFAQIDNILVFDTGQRPDLILDQFDLGDATELRCIDHFDSHDLI